MEKKLSIREETERSTHSYVAQCPECGAYCCAQVDIPSLAKDTAKNIAAWIRDGLIITRVEHEFVRQNFSICKCKPGKERVRKSRQKPVPENDQLSLF
jgi:hypothetical protein